jgi:4-diphosphocytidyl-2-C-methyl-D-erythritol kinase
VLARLFSAMSLRRLSPCKVNLLLNILGKRADGFHELETLFHHVPLHDELEFALSTTLGVQFTCDQPELPVDSSNLVVRAANRFLEAAALSAQGVRIHLAKRIPLAAGLGGGSSNAAHTLLGLNELFGFPLDAAKIDQLAAALGSDVNFFLQDRPALATGRGEKVVGLEPFQALKGCAMLLFHPGFGISTAWAYGELARHPAALNGTPGRAADLAARFQSGDLTAAGSAMYNSLEAPALHKYPILRLYQDFLREHGAWAALMSGSGSTTFALFHSRATADAAIDPFQKRFGSTGWLQAVTF